MMPREECVCDNVRVKRQCLHSSSMLENQLLLVDEIMKDRAQQATGPS